jgi:hypothetical protein
MKVFGLSILAYAVVSFLLFGNILMPAFFMTMHRDHLGAPYWWLLVAASAALAGYSAGFLSRRFEMAPNYDIPVFIVLWMVFSVVSVGIYADWIRRERLRDLNPDTSVQHSFFRSIREVPRDFQFFFHTAALKDCKPYAWSYGQMVFYELRPNVAINVLPAEWIKRCNIVRTR